MNIDENTKVLARLHHSPNNRGLSIYNPYFLETNTNAVYLLFHNKDPKPLVQGLRDLNISGAIPAGFESDPQLIKLVDKLDPIAKEIGGVGLISNTNGKLTGHVQSGDGLLDAILEITDIEDKKIVLMGAGNVAKGLLFIIKERGLKPQKIEIYNRTLEKAELLASKYKSVTKAGSLGQMEKSTGDIFVNTTTIGSPWCEGDDYVFSEKFINNFKFIVDVTFVPLKPQLIKVSEKLGKKTAPGWKMFLYQGRICLEKTLGIKVDLKILSKHIVKDFKTNWS